jgi:hypothetical protein
VSVLREEAALNAIGEIAIRQAIVGYLGQRLQIEDWYHRHPEINVPLIGLGLPRTGSTALSCLLDEDPNARSLRRGQSAQPWQSALFPSGRGFGDLAYPPRPDGSPSYNEGYLFHARAS